ncbi:T9SS type A sorting domain-containing protein [Xanthomarina spongicola]|uniref:Putative secreted protein (Por secretion system target) n=1 Tax=Xanthomarina spongicola TaxID=570520 RepID=A0A316DJ29_9FLAO|nr:T9SS type A sorting domain-containing protein [Xanthomarina spongicola]PWK17905.1 putative secreted protein (Por secretion system target) [Xanthomarina spongicola]
MKKITLSFIGIFTLITSLTFSQTYSTGVIELLNDGNNLYTAQIEVTTSLVTLTLSGPDNKYLGLGFDAMSMTAGKDVVIWLNDGTFKLTDRSFLGVGAEPALDVEQDWTIISNTSSGGQRNVVATRLPDTGNSDDFVFSTSASSIDLVWSFEDTSSYTLGWHGILNRGMTRESFTLSAPSLTKTDFKIYPNPGKTYLNIHLPEFNADAYLEVFDILGKKIYANTLGAINNRISVSKWPTGVYIVRVTLGEQSITKRFIKQ